MISAWERQIQNIFLLHGLADTVDLFFWGQFLICATRSEFLIRKTFISIQFMCCPYHWLLHISCHSMTLNINKCMKNSQHACTSTCAIIYHMVIDNSLWHYLPKHRFLVSLKTFNYFVRCIKFRQYNGIFTIVPSDRRQCAMLWQHKSVPNGTALGKIHVNPAKWMECFSRIHLWIMCKYVWVYVSHAVTPALALHYVWCLSSGFSLRCEYGYCCCCRCCATDTHTTYYQTVVIDTKSKHHKLHTKTTWIDA